MTRPRRAPTIRAAFAALLPAALLLAAPARAAYHPLDEIPVESPLYRLIEEVATTHGAGQALLHTRPWNRADLARFVTDVARADSSATGDPAWVRLSRERAPAAVPGGWPSLVRAQDEQSALEASAYVRTDYAEDRARGTVVRDLRAGVQGSLALGERVQLAGDVYAGTTSPGGHGNPTNSRRFGLIEGVQLNSYFDRATATVDGRYGRVTLGHTWLRWGPGAWGTMALSDAAPAFDLLEARVPFLGRAQLEWFVASLDPATETYLAGHRIELRPANGWDVSFAELARFDGAANAPLYLVPLIPYSHEEKRVIKSSNLVPDSLQRLGKNNVMWAFDAAWRARRDLRVYGELAVDDISFSSEPRPRALAWQAGFDARRVAGGRAWTLRGEYSRVYQFTYSVAHHHDFEFAGLPTGFDLGPDAERWNARLECRPVPGWSVGAEGTLTRKGEGQLGEYYVPGSGHVDNLPLLGVVDQDARAALTVDWSPAGGLLAGVTAGWARVRSLGHAVGDDPDGVFVQTRGTLRW